MNVLRAGSVAIKFPAVIAGAILVIGGEDFIFRLQF
jgi:hypothetical protein